MIDAARIAPDAASLGAAQRAAVSHLWPVAAMSARALWGEHLGSQRYEVAVDLGDGASKCTCPSRKIPCKHVLALLLLAADGLPTKDEPAAVAQWLDKRHEQRRDKAPAVVKDAEAQAARKDARVEKVDLGIARLDRFFEDVVRQGLGALDGVAGDELMRNEMRRLIDAQAGGLASRLGGVAARVGSGGDWAGAVLDRLGRMALLSEAWQRRDGLDEGLLADVRALIGFPVPEEEVRTHGDIVRDTWFVLSDTTEPGEQVRTGRAWLRGKTSGRDALHLRFAPGNAPFGDSWAPGSEVDATLAFYPSAFPQRALVLEKAPPVFGAKAMPRVWTIAQMLEAWSDALARQPWLERLPVALGPVEVTAERVFDSSGSLPIAVDDALDLLAVAGGEPLTLGGEWTGERFVVLSALQHGWFSVIAHTPPTVPTSTDVSRFANVAVIGTARRPMTEDDVDPEVRALDGSIERRLLLAAGCEAVRRAAGRAPGALPIGLGAAPPETRPVVPAKLAARIEALLGDAQLAPEVVRAIDQKGLRVPPDLVTRALPFVRRQPELVGMLGERAKWLAAIGAMPTFVTSVDEPEKVFVEGKLEARVTALRALRERERERARAALRGTWREDKPDVRMAFLDVVREEVGEDDRVFLEGLLNDRSQLVRQRVRAVLGEIRGTEVWERHRLRIAAICKPPRLELPLADAQWAEDGLERPGQAVYRFGERAWRLCELATGAPPALWYEVGGLAPAALVEALAPSDNVFPWLLGLMLRPLDAAWAVALSFGIPSISWPRELEVARDSYADWLFAQVPEPQRDRLAARWLERFPNTRFDAWGPEVSRAVIRNIELAGDHGRPNEAFAIALDPRLIQTALEVPSIRRTYRVAALLELRLRFHQELNLAAKPSQPA